MQKCQKHDGQTARAEVGSAVASGTPAAEQPDIRGGQYEISMRKRQHPLSKHVGRGSTTDRRMKEDLSLSKLPAPRVVGC